MTMKGQKQRPYDEAAAISAAAQCRAMREQIGMNQEALARAARVTVRSVTRWESPDGAGYCPDDVLTMLAALIDNQRAASAAYADRAAADRGGARAGGVPKPDLNQEGAGCKPGVTCGGPGGPDSTPGGPRFDAGEADSMPGGGAGSRFDAGAGARDADSMPYGADDSMPCNDDAIRFDAIAMPYWPSQRAYEELHGADGSFHGVANATLRAIADELDRCGIEVEWRYPTHQNIGMFDIRLIEI